MNNILKISLCLLSATAVANADEFYGKSESAGRTWLSNLNNTKEAVLVSTPSETTGAFYAGNGQTMKKMTVVDRSSGSDEVGDANIAFDFTLDANSVDAAQVLSVKNLTLKSSNAVVTNTASSSALVSLDINKLVLDGENWGSGGYQTQKLTFKNVNAKVNTADTTQIGITAGTSSSITIDSGANVEWNGNIHAGKRNTEFVSNSGLFVNGTLSMNGDIAVYGYAAVGEGGVLNMNGNNLSMMGTVDIRGTVNFGSPKNSDSRVYNYGALNINSANPASQLVFYNIDSQYGGTVNQAVATGANTGIRIKGVAQIYNGSNWTVNEKLELQGSDASNIAQLNLRENGAAVRFVVGDGQTARFALLGNSRATINAVDSISTKDGGAVKLLVEGDNNSLVLGAAQSFSEMELNGNLELTLSAGAQLFLTGETAPTLSIADGKLFTIYNFMDDTIYVGEHFDDAVLLKIKAYNSSMELLQIGVKDGFLTSSIPEPAEWAAVFGAFALGFAAYRRRRQ